MQEETMKRLRSTVSMTSFVLFLVVAVSGLILFFAPHPEHRQAVQAAGRAVREGGVSTMLIIKKSHEYVSLLMTLFIGAHIWINWNSLKAYLLRK